jgi:hypothetical protein
MNHQFLKNHLLDFEIIDGAVHRRVAKIWLEYKLQSHAVKPRQPQGPAMTLGNMR